MDAVQKTGEVAKVTGRYEFVSYVDGTKTPAPTQNERVIPVKAGDKFPPVKSSNKAAYWKLIG